MSDHSERRSRSDYQLRRDREADAALKALRDKLSGVLRRLPDVERRVLELRMGLVDGNPHKPGEVASRMGMTIPEVKRIEARAFERIREVGPIKGLEKFLER
ncbi:MAG: sigma factor-like helix-turn-helix DNA-binding protein [Egibacteraceae bacterium]